MSRFLFVSLPLAGHVYPASGIARSLTSRGHDVMWVGSESRLRPMLGPGAVVYPTGMRPYRGLSDFGMAAVKSLWEFAASYARFTLPSVEKAAQAFGPDVIVADQHAMSGALAASRLGLPWATVCCSTMELAEPLAKLPKVDAWIHDRMAAIWTGAKLPPPAPDLRFSPYLVIACTGRALTGEDGIPPGYALIGASLGERPPAPPGPADPAGQPAPGHGGILARLDPARRHVLVTAGTMLAEVARDRAGFYERAVEALRPLEDVQGIVIAPPEALPGVPGHVLVASRVPVLDLLPHLDLVVCHAGLNIVCEALAHGVPLVVAPANRDQPVNAAQVARAGAGVRVSFTRVSPGQLRTAITGVLGDPGYRAAAQAVRDSFAAAGGSAEAARRLELLAPVAAAAGS
jgi:UDP:flavonoid glycosyltransferase YjiC (YdhE family)